MKDKMTWAFMMRISNHMWNDESWDKTSRMYFDPTFKETNDVDLETWDEIIAFLAERKFNMIVLDVGDGLEFDSHPEISAPDAWSKELLKQKIDEAKAVGIEIIPKLNFSTGHDTWLKEYRRMVSTPKYYEVCADLIAETCEAFGKPRLFHLGLDEEKAKTQRHHEMAIIRHSKLYWHDVHFLFAECEKNGARPWIWSDMYWAVPEEFLANVPKNVLISNWFYDVFRDDYEPGYYAHTRIKAYEELDRAGYEQIPTSACIRNNNNTRQTVAFAEDRLTPKLLKGFMSCPWTPTTKDTEYLLKWDADRLYLAREMYYPETLED